MTDGTSSGLLERLPGLTLERARGLVAQHGSIDRAAKAAGHPVGRFRTFCRDHGVTARAHVPVVGSDSDDVGISREAMLVQEVKELKASVRKLSEQATRDERVLELAEDLLPALKPKYRAPRASRASSARTPKLTPHEAVLLWGDVHAAEVVTAEDTGGLNTYDWATMLERHALITESVRSFLAHRPYPIRKLHVAGLGDFLSGTIHDLNDTNEMPILEATLHFGLDAADWLADLASGFEAVNLVGVYGNHGRTGGFKPKTKASAVNNYDWLALEIMRLRLAGHSHVTVEASKSPHAVMNVLGRTFFVFHGDGVSSASLVKRVRELEKTYAAMGRIDHWVCGHFHSAAVLEQGRIFVNGSVVGPSGYSVKNFGGGSMAQQTLLLVHPEWGVTEVLPIDLQNRLV